MSDWVAHTLMAGGTVIAVLLVYLQVQKQHKSTLVLQEEHLKNEIRLKIYERIADSVEECSKLIGVAVSEARNAVTIISAGDRQQVENLPQTGMSIIQAKHVATGAVAQLMRVIERYEIAFPGFVEMRLGLSQGAQEVNDVTVPFIGKASLYLPIETSDAEGRQVRLRPLVVPEESDISELNHIHELFDEALHKLEAYTADVQIEAQNVLLGNLFNRQIPARQPGDPRYRVLKPGSYES